MTMFDLYTANCCWTPEKVLAIRVHYKDQKSVILQLTTFQAVHKFESFNVVIFGADFVELEEV